MGAEWLGNGVARFRVWARRPKRVAVVIEPVETGGSPRSVELQPEADGYFSTEVDRVEPNGRYWYQLDGEERLLPDPASRFQPDGPHGPSQLVDPRGFPWTDGAWRGATLHGQVIYEMHIGTFTAEGTWEAAARQLPALVETGVTLVEVMPVADFPGSFGWGYDGVNLFAPTRLYGTPDDFRQFVDRAHALGMAVILDVVYNHFGPDGCYLAQFSQDYFSTHENEWGTAINFDGEHAGPVREFFLANAGYWIEEFHLDGLRLDATQSIHDSSDEHILAAISRRVREVARDRRVVLVAENEPEDVKLIKPIDRGGYGLDALWNDDFHHSAVVALTGRAEAYYSDHSGTPQEFISAAKWGYLSQGQRYAWQKQRRGTPALGISSEAFICYIENHDQVANSAAGLRLNRQTTPGRLRAMTALFLLLPSTPMLFQGQEFGASSPFLFFADHKGQLAQDVRRGRKEFLRQFPSLATEEAQAQLAPPDEVDTFLRSKLNHEERLLHVGAYTLHRDLLRLRRTDPTFKAQGWVDGAVLGAETFVLRFFGGPPATIGEGGDRHRLLIVNLGGDQLLAAAPEPLLAPPADMRWQTLWSSEHPIYGGIGTPEVETDEGWRIRGHAAVVLEPVRRDSTGSST